jgi:hypothetical protein
MQDEGLCLFGADGFEIRQYPAFGVGKVEKQSRHGDPVEYIGCFLHDSSLWWSNKSHNFFAILPDFLFHMVTIHTSLL